MCARRRARRACSSNSRVIGALPRLGSSSSRSSSCLLAPAPPRPPALVRPLEHRPPGRGQHPLRRRRAPTALARAAASASLRAAAPSPASRAARSASPAGQAARTQARSRARRPRAVELLGDVRRRDRAEADRPAARRDRLQQPPGRGAGEHEVRETRRAPRASSAARSGTRRSCGPRPTITNTRRCASNGRSAAWRTTSLAHVVDEDLVRAPRLDPGDVGMHARQHPPPRVRQGPRSRARSAPPRTPAPPRACRCRGARGRDRRATARPGRAGLPRARCARGADAPWRPRTRHRRHPRQHVACTSSRGARGVDAHVAVRGAARPARRRPPRPRAGAPPPRARSDPGLHSAPPATAGVDVEQEGDVRPQIAR